MEPKLVRVQRLSPKCKDSAKKVQRLGQNTTMPARTGEMEESGSQQRNRPCIAWENRSLSDILFLSGATCTGDGAAVDLTVGRWAALSALVGLEHDAFDFLGRLLSTCSARSAPQEGEMTSHLLSRRRHTHVGASA